MSSFHHNDTVAGSSNNAVLQASAASILKTETSIGADEFQEFEFFGTRQEEDDSPENVNNEVALVFSIREPKAMLQFCAQTRLEEDLLVSMFFHWGGKPIIFETESSTFRAELVMATLDHKLLGSLAQRRRPSHRSRDD
mmetsp:Transcript_25579/g.59409  ORF Transcript_25579/g.59409 Transcript_25579/m.59409 type:complete len:139 (-) Transcript_25579:32-448(-)